MEQMWLITIIPQDGIVIPENLHDWFADTI